jgi:aspartyl-tRNA(Asn)/glutamyl-tRNA(Gln) amidotransferase subunit A
MNDWTLSALAGAIRAREVSAVEITEACLERIARSDARLRTFITIDRNAALTIARAVEDNISRGRDPGALAGVPLGYKDLCRVNGLPTSCGTKTAEYFIDGAECTAVTRLCRAGGVTVGKLNMTELALGPFGENAHHGDVQNPWRYGYASGGSSSGSAAAVAAGLVHGALGSDTGGSIRLPAACCGIVGLKPTYGRVSRAGAMPLSWSLDHLGPMARTVRDVAVLLGVIAGHDALDATSSRRSVPDYVRSLDNSVRAIRVGLPENFYFDGVDAAVDRALRLAARTIETLGAKIEPIRLPDPEVLVGTANVLARCESSTIHARLVKDRPHELQPTVRLRLETGFHIPAYDYLQAARLRARLTRHFITDVFEGVDVLITPTIPEPAPSYETVKAGTAEERVRRMGRFSRLTRPFNALGLPALSVPCGFSDDGRPLGLQIVGRPFAEATILRLGHAYEQAAGWHLRHPPLDID